MKDCETMIVKKLCRTTTALLLMSLLFISQAFAAKKDALNEAMMGENISSKFTDFAIQRKSIFTVNSNEVIWFASFKGFIGAPEAKLRAEWITPAGETFKDEKFSTRYGNSRFGWAKLDIKGVDKKALELEGEWIVRIYWDDELIDTQKFYMGERKFATVSQQSLPRPVITPQEMPKTVTAVLAKSDKVVSTASPAPSAPASPGAKPQDIGRHVRTMVGNQLVYEGSEKIDPALWKTEITPFNELKIISVPATHESIAVLAYPFNLDTTSWNNWFNRGNFMASEIKKSGFKMGSILKEETLPEQYKYLFRYNLDQKKIEINFFSENSDVYLNLVEFSEEKDKVKNVMGLFGNGMFPHDLSYHIARKTIENLTKNDYKVLDLTACRDELAGKSLAEIMTLVHNKYGIDKVMFIPIKVYTKWVWDSGTRKEIEIGLLMCYSVVIFERDKPEPVFTFTDNIDIGNKSFSCSGDERKNISNARINFYSEDWSEDRKIHPDRPIKFYKDGVLDDVWATSIILSRFTGEQMISVKDLQPIHTGGALFVKLVESGSLSKETKK